MDIERTLCGNIAVEVGLNNMSARPFEAYIREERNIIGISIHFNRKFRRCGHDNFLSIRPKDLYLCFKLPIPHPMINDCKFQQRRGESLKKDVLEDAHERKFIPHFDANIIADQRVDKLSCPHAMPRRTLSSSLL